MNKNNYISFNGRLSISRYNLNQYGSIFCKQSGVSFWTNAKSEIIKIFKTPINQEKFILNEGLFKDNVKGNRFTSTKNIV